MSDQRPPQPPYPGPPPGYVGPPPGYPPPGYLPPAGSYGHPRRPPPASSEAIAAVVLAVFAWTCFPAGFVALWLGARARRLARENPETVGGEQMGLVAMILGGILGGLGALVLLGYIGLVVGMAVMHGP